VFDHSFFHLVKLSHSTRGTPRQDGGRKFKAREEIPLILAEQGGFGLYSIDPFRAPYLPAAHQTFLWPEAIVERTDLESATHVFYREYSHPKVPFTVTLVKRENDRFVPVTSFACDKRKIRRWRDEVPGGVATLIWKKP
jgi:hypothetical protein